MSGVSYSRLLTEFIDPFLDGQENESDYLEKAGIGMVAWNYHTAKAAKSRFLKHVRDVYLQFRRSKANSPAIMDALLRRKEKSFNQYRQFLVRVDMRPDKDGNSVLFVESIAIEMLPGYVAAMQQGAEGDISKGKLGLKLFSF